MGNPYLYKLLDSFLPLSRQFMISCFHRYHTCVFKARFCIIFITHIDQPALCFTWVASTSYWGIRPYHQKGKSVDRELCSNGLVLPPSKVCATLFCACASPYYEILVVATYPPKVHLAYLRQLRQYRKWHLQINYWWCCSESQFIVNFLQTPQILFNKMTIDVK